jgi:hypothetical protein
MRETDLEDRSEIVIVLDVGEPKERFQWADQELAASKNGIDRLDSVDKMLGTLLRGSQTNDVHVFPVS